VRDDIVVSEIFGPTLQGEGPLVGLPTVFVRTGGCDFRCTWCDSMYAVDPSNRPDWENMTPGEVLDRITHLTRGFPLLVSLSGGNPALMPLGGLIERGHELGYTFALETQGTVERGWFAQLDHLILSPKGPSAGMRYERKRLQKCVEAAGGQTEMALKVVVFSEDDYQFARDLHADFGELPMYLQAGTPPIIPLAGVPEDERAEVTASDMRSVVAGNTVWLLERVKKDRWFDVHVGCQLHVMLWGAKRGV
jgi:7-carboxy-7-deazaguanine synthase